MQNKTRVRCYYICTRMAKPKEKHKHQIASVEETAKQREISYTASGSGKWYSHFGKQFESFLKS